ncbi:uncharacterized protein LOC113466843 [Diaphorina citri]|uniref:Uncharacterized protein LOC113466843 n=1 Tax=Diaphorina citri TaxID=121845 RepID=A0A3Q0IQ75_DIACI|nr:uncharacterized protein LOC113466843 [Diaphorina citri]
MQGTLHRYMYERPDCVNRTDSESFSALFYAVIHNHVDVVELLLEAKAAPNMIDIHGRTVLEIAILKQYNDIIEILHPGYLQQQDEDMMAMNQTKSNQIIYDYITLFKNNLPHPSAIKSTGFYTNVIEMLNACELLDFSSDIIEKQMSLFQFTNINSDTLKEHNIHLNYQRNEILNAIKVFHLHKWKLARSVMNKTNKKKIKLDELIYYTYLICEQMYVDYSALNYIENQKFKIKDLAEKCSDNMNYAKTLMRLSVILNKYERYVENVILKDNCLHPAGFIEDINSSKSLKWIVGCVVPALGFTVLYGYFKK